MTLSFLRNTQLVFQVHTPLKKNTLWSFVNTVTHSHAQHIIKTILQFIAGPKQQYKLKQIFT